MKIYEYLNKGLKRAIKRQKRKRIQKQLAVIHNAQNN